MNNKELDQIDQDWDLVEPERHDQTAAISEEIIILTRDDIIDEIEVLGPGDIIDETEIFGAEDMI